MRFQTKLHSSGRAPSSSKFRLAPPGNDTGAVKDAAADLSCITKVVEDSFPSRCYGIRSGSVGPFDKQDLRESRAGEEDLLGRRQPDTEPHESLQAWPRKLLFCTSGRILHVCTKVPADRHQLVAKQSKQSVTHSTFKISRVPTAADHHGSIIPAVKLFATGFPLRPELELSSLNFKHTLAERASWRRIPPKLVMTCRTALREDCNNTRDSRVFLVTLHVHHLDVHRTRQRRFPNVPTLSGLYFIVGAIRMSHQTGLSTFSMKIHMDRAARSPCWTCSSDSKREGTFASSFEAGGPETSSFCIPQVRQIRNHSSS